MKGYAAFEAAFKQGVKQANHKRRKKNEHAFDMFFMSSDLSEPTKKKKQLNFPGIQSTHGVTFFREEQKIINHIYPDVDDRLDWIEIPSDTIESDYVRVDKNGVKQRNFLLPPYAEVKDVIIDVTKIDRTEKQRDTWESLVLARREREQELLPLRAT